MDRKLHFFAGGNAMVTLISGLEVVEIGLAAWILGIDGGRLFPSILSTLTDPFGTS